MFSSRALFDLEEENEIFEKEGVEAFRAYQQEHENKPLEPGTAFHLIKNLLALNKAESKQVVEVVIMSRNTPETGLRVLKSIEKHELDIKRMALSGGEPLASYIKAFYIDLFLSKDEKDVQSIIDSKTCAAAIIYTPPKAFDVNKQNK